MIFNMASGGGAGGAGGGATLVVSSPANVSVTASKDDKSYTKNSGSLGSTIFKGLTTGTWSVTISGNGQTATKTIEITADYAMTIAFFSATIKVTYPANSTCTCTDGTTTFTDTNTGTSAKTTTFTVPNAGTWTVKSVSGSDIASQNVSVTTSGQSYSVTLDYYYYIVKNGSYANGYKFAACSYNESTPSITADSGYIQIKSAQGGSVSITSPNLSKYSTMVVTLSLSTDSWGAIVFSTDNNHHPYSDRYDNGVAKLDIATSSATITKKTYTLNVSSLSSSYYLKFMGYNVTWKIYDLYFK